jgi:uncharacterized membrane protein YraQ (UPF0718 family)
MTPEDIELFFLLVTAIFMEAAPFLLVGALLGSILEVYVPAGKLLRYIPRNHAGGILLGLCAGMILPTCECGVVPITRRLMLKGVPAHVAITYLFAAPVINPIVLISTYVAFREDLGMVLARVGLVALPAVVIGFLFRSQSPPSLIRGGKVELPMASTCDHCGHDHGPGDHHHQDNSGQLAKLREILRHTALEFLDMARFLALGAIASALFKILIPPELFAMFAKNVFLAVGAMMALAILLSVCSEADAFVAASFSTFNWHAQLAFVAIGPMVDLKLIGMYGAAFNKRAALLMILIPMVLVYISSLALYFLMGT